MEPYSGNGGNGEAREGSGEGEAFPGKRGNPALPRSCSPGSWPIPHRSRGAGSGACWLRTSRLTSVLSSPRWPRIAATLRGLVCCGGWTPRSAPGRVSATPPACRGGSVSQGADPSGLRSVAIVLASRTSGAAIGCARAAWSDTSGGRPDACAGGSRLGETRGRWSSSRR